MSVDNPNTIDFVGHNPQTDIVTLGMVEEREWDGSEQRRLELEEKIQNYFSFIVDGQFAKTYPTYANKPMEMKLSCETSPDIETGRFIETVKARLAEYNIGFVIAPLKRVGP